MDPLGEAAGAGLVLVEPQNRLTDIESEEVWGSCDCDPGAIARPSRRSLENRERSRFWRRANGKPR
jgi:hypothetical protein